MGKKTEKESILKNPVTVVALIGAFATIIAAIISRPVSPPTISEPALTETIIAILQTHDFESTLIAASMTTPTFQPSKAIPFTDTVTPTTTTIPTGTITPTDTVTSEPMTATPDPMIFIDNFDKSLEPDWVVVYGEYLITNGQLALPENGEFEIELGNLSLTNYSVEMDVYLRPDTWSQFVFNKSLRASFQARQGDRWEVYKGNNWEILTKWSVNNLPTNFKLVIEVQGNSFELYLNGQLITQIVYGDKITNSIGIRMKDAGPVDEGTLDNFVIKKYE